MHKYRITYHLFELSVRGKVYETIAEAMAEAIMLKSLVRPGVIINVLYEQAFHEMTPADVNNALAEEASCLSKF